MICQDFVKFVWQPSDPKTHPWIWIWTSDIFWRQPDGRWRSTPSADKQRELQEGVLRGVQMPCPLNSLFPPCGRWPMRGVLLCATCYGCPNTQSSGAELLHWESSAQNPALDRPHSCQVATGRCAWGHHRAGPVWLGPLSHWASHWHIGLT